MRRFTGKICVLFVPFRDGISGNVSDKGVRPDRKGFIKVTIEGVEVKNKYTEYKSPFRDKWWAKLVV